ncbi:TetR/AcrR family transcriptional regulator [Phytomonospora endophytica]|uniref:AcrR family transcriptional regulator n=1 Tax=Phytomonospora endophytica TaxID=714109 RepID=A0A841FHK7_9ACTN|nr:TetR family transcriptional regulator C-terminal domain-containing protein [Phytomonospora endophytica]MBB6032577.1 AcrR family transcriptional regulator [Phytomonospora endophytica]GIG66273.1 TetR family transcriptional regulator [Phytomonospora endophytica]
MPARGDHDARRRDLSEAVWRVVAEQGFTGLTMRAVAAEMDASTGLVTHYFPSKAALVRHALELAAERVDTMERHVPSAPGLAGLRAAILDVVPVDPERVAMNRVWVSSWDLALADPTLGEAQRERYDRWRARLRGHVEAAVARGELPDGADVDDVAVSAAAFTHGLVTQALFDPAAFPVARLEGLVAGFVEGLGSQNPNPS